MTSEYEAIVVGAGAAGLTAAAYLCRAGIGTLLLEKSDHTGGLAGTFPYRDFTFDAGIRAFENSGILHPMLKSLGIDIEFTANPVRIGIGNRWVSLGARESLNEYTAMLTEFFPSESGAIQKIGQDIVRVMRYMDVLYGIDNPLFLDDMTDLKYVTKTLLPWLFKYQINIRKAERLHDPVRTYLKRYTLDEALIDMITQHFFANTPAFFALSYFGLYPDYMYPMGGTGVLAGKLTEYIRNRRGEIRTGTEAQKIDLQKKEIRLSDGQTLTYKKLVWAADQKTLYRIAEGLHTSKIEEQRRLTMNGSGGDSILTLFIGADLDREYFEAHSGPHAFYTPSAEGLSSLPPPPDAIKEDGNFPFDRIGLYLEKTTYEISCPALRDASLAPEGKTGVIVSTLMDYDVVRFFSEAGDYEFFKKYCTEKITDVLERSLYPGIKDKILFALCSTPLTIEKETGNSGGAITGWAFTNAEMPAGNHFRKIARSVETPIPDVVQCGQWTFSPSGLPVSVLTGKLAADEVIKSLKGGRNDTNHH